MKARKVFFILFISIILFPLASQEGKDVVLVVDTASSMFSYYNEVGTYLSRSFLPENLTSGDTLHIISFGSKPRFEIVRRIRGEGDMDTASARIWLLYPLDPSSDPAAAINYTEQYTRSIQGERAKKVFFVSDSDLSGQVSAAAGRFPPNTELQFIQASSRMGSGKPGVASDRSGTASSGSTSGTGSAAGSSGGTTGTGGTGSATDTDSSGGSDSSPGQTDPGTSQSGEQSASGSGATAGETVQGTGGTGSAAGTSGGNSSSGFNFRSIPLPLIIAGALLLLLLLLFIILLIRKLQSSPKKAMAEISSGGSAASNDAELLNSYASRQAVASLQGPNRRYHYRSTSSQFLTKPPMLNIFVEEQNTGIGRRNIHAMKKGSTYSVGGGNSDFLIFLVDFPSNIGRLYFDGTNCTFTPLKSEYFPDIGSTPVTECIGKPVRIVSRKNYEVFFHFEPYKDPLVEMNQLLNSVKVPEPPPSDEE